MPVCLQNYCLLGVARTRYAVVDNHITSSISNGTTFYGTFICPEAHLHKILSQSNEKCTSSHSHITPDRGAKPCLRFTDSSRRAILAAGLVHVYLHVCLQNCCLHGVSPTYLIGVYKSWWTVFVKVYNLQPIVNSSWSSIPTTNFKLGTLRSA